MDRQARRAPAVTLAVGRRLGPYEITGKLGAGGMGEVYRAIDTRLGREVAIKVLPAAWANDRERLERFENEARAASALNHANILTVHDFGSEEGVPYLVTELLRGETVRALLARGPVPRERARAIAIDVCRGLAAAHRAGVVHRDLKPENLFLVEEGPTKILDFGLARVESPEIEPDQLADSPTLLATAPGTVLGTAAYMAPEQVRSERADARSDLFALGVVLQEMLTGENPFQRDSIVESLHAILKEDVAAESSAMSQTAGPLAPVVRRCLEKDPQRRFQSASDLGFALEALSGASPALHPAPPRQRRRGGAWIVAAMGVATLAVIVLLLVSYRSSPAATAAESPIRSLAVLPFANLSEDRANDYFSAGMTEALTTELAQLTALKVIANNSAAHFRDSSRPLGEIAHELGVEGLISGSVLRQGDRVRISARLQAAESGRVVWAESYERPAQDVLALQGEVARAIAEALALRLSPEEESRLRDGRTVDPRALDEYLEGRYLWTQRTERSVRAGLSHFRAAVDLDPSFALGETGIADSYIILAAYDWMEPHEALPLAVAAAERAQQLDPRAGEPHASRGDLAIHYDRDLVRAAAELDRAIELSPGYAPAYHWRGEAALFAGRFDEAVRFMSKALELDPRATAAQAQIATAYQALGDPAKAERSFRLAHEISPGYSSPAGELVRIDLEAGRAQAGLAAARRAVEEDPTPSDLATLGVALALTGDPDGARTELARLAARQGSGWLSPYELARVEAALGEREAMLRHLQQAVDANVFAVQALSVAPDLEFRRYLGQPAFEAIRGGIWKRR